jgi:DNA-binding NtrC family response regulator
MARIALIDDDLTEAMVIGGLLEHTTQVHSLQHFVSIDAFLKGPDGEAFDLVLLDRRIPPHASFASSLASLRDGPYRGPIALISAGSCDETGLAGPGPLYGPLDKGDLLTPQALEMLISKALPNRSQDPRQT